MSEVKLEDAKQFMDKLDEATNGSEKINVEVFKVLFSKELNRTLNETHINNIFKEGIDSDGNGEMDFDEFMAVFSFVMCDVNGDGYLYKEDLKQLIFVFFDRQISDEDAEYGLNTLDDDGNGKICYSEWRHFILAKGWDT